MVGGRGRYRVWARTPTGRSALRSTGGGEGVGDELLLVGGAFGAGVADDAAGVDHEQTRAGEGVEAGGGLAVHVGEDRPLPARAAAKLAHGRRVVGPMVGHDGEYRHVACFIPILYPFPAHDSAEIAPTVEVDNDRLPLQILEPYAVSLADGQQVKRGRTLADPEADGGGADILGMGALVEMTAGGEREDEQQRQQ